MSSAPVSKTKAPTDSMTTSPTLPLTTVGRSVPRYELAEKLSGAAQYSADISLPGMLHGVIVRSPHPHADVLSVDASEALALPGVRAVVTPADAPNARLAPDMLVLDTRVRFAGDEVAAVAADDLDTARRAAALVRVEYNVLPFVTDPVAALEPEAPQIHPHGNLAIPEPLALQRGDPYSLQSNAGFAAADIVLEETYHLPTHSATPLEPRAALASWEDDRLTVWKSTRGVHVDRGVLAEALGLGQADVPRHRPQHGRQLRQQRRITRGHAGCHFVPSRGVSRAYRVQPRGGVRGRAHPPRRSHQPAHRHHPRR